MEVSNELAAWPATITRQPWRHQHEGYDRLGRLWYAGQPGVALFSGMGTGKSLVALALIEAFGFRRTLILCPKAMLEEWPAMIERDSARLIPVPLTGSTKYRAQYVRDTFGDADSTSQLVYVCNIESFYRDELYIELAKRQWDCIVIDESQKIKSPGSKTSMRAHTLGKRARYRLIMTGTPLHDKPLDAYGQFRFLDSRIFGTRFTDFGHRYAEWRVLPQHGIEIPTGYINLDELSAKMDSVSFRVTEDVLDLPELLEIPRHFALSDVERDCYEEMERDAVVELGTVGYVMSPNALAKLGRLQQITSGYLPLTDDDGETQETTLGHSRANAFCGLLEELDASLPVVVFARYTYDLSDIRRIATELGRPYYELSGRASQWREWRDATDNGVIGVQIQAGSAGIDLTRSPYAIFYSRSFSLGDYQQAVRRVYRPGQLRTTYVYHVLANETVDEKIYEALREKRDVADFVLDAMRRELGLDTTAGDGSAAPLPVPTAAV